MIGRRRPATARHASGATLAEVLISMMILGIGVVSLASLFPVGMLSSVRATKLTHATMLRDNCEAILDVMPDVIHDPDRDGNYIEHNFSIYAVDPYGYVRIQDNQGNPAPFGPLPRFHAGFNNETLALSLVGLPDSWSDYEGTARTELMALQSDRVKVSSKFNLIDVQQDLLTSSVRVFLVDPGGQQSRVRTVTGVQPANGIITWAANQPVPPSAISRLSEVRVERQEIKYTWMLTVRKPYFTNGLARATVDVIVFFKRPLSIFNELTYPATLGDGADNAPGVAGVNDNAAGQADDASERGWPGSDDRRTMRVSYAEGETKPNLRRGTFLFDPDNGQWYRIEQVLATFSTEDTNGNGQLDPGEDLNGNQSIDTSEDVNGNGGLDPGEDLNGNGIIDGVGSAAVQVDRDIMSRGVRVMAPQGIVSVFPLGTK